jgi:adenylate kinase
MRTIALVGLSGVGKSALLRRLAVRTPLRHLQASQMIKAELAAHSSRPISSEQLRLGSVLDNQSLLISGFARATIDRPDLVVFDGHTVIDAPGGLIEIPARVFSALKVCHLVFLKGHPNQIALQRRNDTARFRPQRSPEELESQQNLAIAVARQIACDLDVPLTIIAPDEFERLQTILQDAGSLKSP